ncbi:MAG: epoxyqueuosine reductase QueH [bacterium]
MNSQKKLLVHICCAPCLSGLSDYLKSLNFNRITGYFYNPNIHPYKEFKKRRHQVRESEKIFGFDEIIYSSEYPLREILQGMLEAENRCEFCFRTRFQKTAEKASELGHSHFSSTLLVSPYQDQELLMKTGNQVADEYSVEFLGEDMRRFYDLSREESKAHGMYCQGYCGCVFSEYERYSKRKLPLMIWRK